MDKAKRCGDIFYLLAFSLWVFLETLQRTGFKYEWPLGDMNRTVQYIVLGLLLGKLVCQSSHYLHMRRILELFVLLLLMTIAYSNTSLRFATSLALVYFAGTISFEKLLKIVLIVQAFVFTVTMIGVETGYIEDMLWYEGDRVRHGLGYTHCLVGSHYVFYLSITLILLMGQLNWYNCLYMLLISFMMYELTDARTDFYLSVLFLATAAGLRLVLWIVQLWRKRRGLPTKEKGNKVLSLLFAAVPVVLCAGSYFVAYACDFSQPFWQKLDRFLTSRLTLADRALQEYPLSLFGQKIRWVGATTKYENPELTYNLVDNAYVKAGLSYGIVFMIVMVGLFAWILYKQCMQRNYLLCIVIVFVLGMGVINEQLIQLAYHPYLLLLSGCSYVQGKPGLVRKKAERERI